MKEKEVWKSITEFDNLYEVSNFGNIRNKATKKIKALHRQYKNAGYYRVNFFNGEKRKKFFVHILVAKYFVNGYEDGFIVNHIDGDKTNNRYSNLEWVSRSYNNKHYIKTKNIKGSYFKQKVEVTFVNGDCKVFESICACARYMGITDKRIHHILSIYNGIDPLTKNLYKRVSND